MVAASRYAEEEPISVAVGRSDLDVDTTPAPFEPAVTVSLDTSAPQPVSSRFGLFGRS